MPSPDCVYTVNRRSRFASVLRVAFEDAMRLLPRIKSATLFARVRCAYVHLRANRCFQIYSKRNCLRSSENFTQIQIDQGFWIYLYFRIRHSFAHLRPVILSADWSISRLQSLTCSSLPTVAEFVKLTQSIVIEIQRQSADLYKVQLCNRQFFCGVHSGLRGKGIRVSPLG